MKQLDNLKVLADAEELAEFCAQRVIAAAAAAVSEHRLFNLAVSGGGTPKLLYRLLAQPVQREQVEWQRTNLFFVDERCVPPEHADSNYRLVRETLLVEIKLPAKNMHRIHGELTAAAAAAAYETEISTLLNAGAPAEQTGRLFDLTLLGLGSDGHTASLFSHHPALHIHDRWVAGVVHRGPPEPAVDRVTLTIPALNRSGEIIFMVSGAEKAGILRQTLDAKTGDPAFPARWIIPADGDLLWAVDNPAASQLV